MRGGGAGRGLRVVRGPAVAGGVWGGRRGGRWWARSPSVRECGAGGGGEGRCAVPSGGG